MAALTPARRAALGSGGYYADASSPIASTPNRKPTVGTSRPALATSHHAPPPTPSLSSLSPMRVSEKPLQRHEDETAKSSGWGGIFSPVLKFFANEEEAAAGATGGAGAMPSSSSSSSSSTAAGQQPQQARQSPATGSVPGTSVPALASPGSKMGGGIIASASPSAKQQASSSAASATPTAAIAARAAAMTLSSPGPGPATATASASAMAHHGGVGGIRPIAPEEEMSTAYCNNPDAEASRIADANAAAGRTTGQGADAADDASYEYEEFNPYLFIKMLPNYTSVAPRVPRIVLPKKKLKAPEINLVLDLDETLVHCSVDPIPDADVTFPVTFNGTSYQVYVRKRPYLDRFLAWIAGRFEVTIFTASQQVYAERLLNLLDPEGRFINYRLYRDSCLNFDGNYLKDLNVLGRDLSKTVLVDNSPHAFGYQLDNGIPIESWFDDRGDTELLKLTRFLETIQHASDVRPLVRDKFKLHKLVQDSVIPRSFYS